MSEPVTGAADVAGLLASWLPRQRWFAAGSGGVILAPAGLITLADSAALPPTSALLSEVAAGAARSQEHARFGTTRYPSTGEGPASEEPQPGGSHVAMVVHLISATQAGSAPDPEGGRSARPATSATYQVPLTYRTAPAPELAAALLGELRTSEGTRWVYDAPHDPAFVAEWMRLVGAGSQASSMSGTPRSMVRGVLRPGEPQPMAVSATHVLSGEQSNTSIIVGDDGDEPVMIKLFRVIQPGRNPDVVIPGALATAGNERVPRLVGWVEGEWVQPDGTSAWGHLSAIAEFVAGSQDGWRLACASIEAGESFAAMSGELGSATAEVHLALSRAMTTRPNSAAALGALADHLDSRLAWATAAVPALTEYAARAAAVISRVRELGTAPDLQIVHGDYHLGQVLHGVGRGWVLLDFEGEPLRPLAERGEPDLALRDVAGMLRSFDYAAAHSVLGLADDDPRSLAAAAWAAACRESFLAGYAGQAQRDPRQDDVLLRALELDKALYETVYETRHRPGWVEVPLRAVDRLLAAPAEARATEGA